MSLGNYFCIYLIGLAVTIVTCGILSKRCKTNRDKELLFAMAMSAFFWPVIIFVFVVVVLFYALFILGKKLGRAPWKKGGGAQ